MWSVSAWGRNLNNQFFFSSRFDLQTGSAFNYIYNHIGAPRTWGFTLGRKF